MNDKYSILVSSTDPYEDCWFPFFKLFNKFWQDKEVKVFLNTEEKEFNYPGLDIISTKIGYKKNNKRFTWSESLLLALEKIETPLVLFILDDLFLDRPVDNGKIDLISKTMLDNDYTVVYLTDQSTSGPFTEKGELLWKLDQKALYRISALIALWNKDQLKKYIRKHENPWQFEIYGTKRASLIKDDFYCVNPEVYNRNGKTIISHCDPTGITRGKWNKKAVVELFKENNIKIDFNKRGFYQPQKRSLKQKINSKLNMRKQLNDLKSSIDLLQTKLNSN